MRLQSRRRTEGFASLRRSSSLRIPLQAGGPGIRSNEPIDKDLRKDADDQNDTGGRGVFSARVARPRTALTFS